MYKHILIATDGSEVGQKGLEHGLSLAEALGAKVTIVTVTETFPIVTSGDFGHGLSASAIENLRASQERAAQAVLVAGRETAERAGVSAETMQMADAPPAEAIIDAAKSQGCDLIVMGSHGRRGLGRIMLGSKASEVVTQGHVPVLVVR